MKKESTNLPEVLSRMYQIIRGRFPQLCCTCKVTSTRTGQLLNGSDITSNYHGHGAAQQLCVRRATALLC